MIQKFSVSVIGSNLPYIFNTQQEAIDFTKKSIFARSSKVDIATKEDLARLKRVYIASPLFTDKEKYRINSVVKELRLLGNTVYSPMEFTVDDAWSLSNEEWSRKVYNHDIDDLEKADTVVCIYDGLMSDTGTAWEVGYAFAKGKKLS